MHYLYAILGFAILALASPIQKQSPRIVVTSLDQASTGETVNGIVGGRGPFIAPRFVAFQAMPKATSTSTTAHGPASSASPSQAPFSLPVQQSQWGPGDISNVLFGCVASFLGAMAVGLPYYLYRRQLRSQQLNGSPEPLNTSVYEPSNNDDALPLQDLPPAYRSVDAPADSLGPHGTEYPVTHS
ncbi:hypothetical protein MMC29_005603 [Sticta canariensis]|nr:hypothetical protein [Sticta canariensis]